MSDPNLFYFGIVAFSLMAGGLILTIQEFKTMGGENRVIDIESGNPDSERDRRYQYADERPFFEIRKQEV